MRLERSICVELFLLAWRSSTASSVIFYNLLLMDLKILDCLVCK